MKTAFPNFPQPSRVIQILLLVFCTISWHGWAAKLDPAPWKIIDFSGSAATNLSLYSGAPLPPSALRILTNNPGGTTFTGDLTSPPGSSPPVNLLTNLTDNK